MVIKMTDEKFRISKAIRGNYKQKLRKFNFYPKMSQIYEVNREPSKFSHFCASKFLEKVWRNTGQFI